MQLIMLCNFEGLNLLAISMSIAPFEGNKVLVLIHDISDRICRSRELIETKRWQKTPIS